jgi:hypothetical protein
MENHDLFIEVCIWLEATARDTFSLHGWLHNLRMMLHPPHRRFTITSGKRGFYPPPLVPKLFGPGLKGALVPVRAAGARPTPSPGS